MCKCQDFYREWKIYEVYNANNCSSKSEDKRKICKEIVKGPDNNLQVRKSQTPGIVEATLPLSTATTARTTPPVDSVRRWSKKWPHIVLQFWIIQLIPYILVIKLKPKLQNDRYFHQ